MGISIALSSNAVAAPPTPPDPANYSLDVSCAYDDLADTTTCQFTSSVTNDRKIIRFVYADAICATILDGDGTTTADGTLFRGATGELLLAGGVHSTGSVEYVISVSGGRAVTIDGSGLVCNAPPIANDDIASTTQDTTVSVAVLSNDTDPDDDALTVIGLTTPANGSTSINTDGTVSYTPSPAFTGSDSFDYTISDGIGGTSTATVTVSVTPVTGIVDVFVRDDETNAAVAGAEVCLSDGSDNLLGCDITSSDGMARFVDVADGDYTVDVDASGYEPEQFLVEYDVALDVANGGVSDTDASTADAIISLDPAALPSTTLDVLVDDQVVAGRNLVEVYIASATDLAGIGGSCAGSFVTSKVSTLVSGNDAEGSDIDAADFELVGGQSYCVAGYASDSFPQTRDVQVIFLAEGDPAGDTDLFLFPR
jgi:hypothetical protein